MPVRLLVLMLHVEHPDSDRTGEQQDRQVHKQERLDADQPDQQGGNCRDRQIGRQELIEGADVAPERIGHPRAHVGARGHEAGEDLRAEVALALRRDLVEDRRVEAVDADVDEIAERVGLSPTPCLRRQRQLEESGLVRGYTAVVDEEAYGLPVTAFVGIRLKVHDAETVRHFERAVQQIDAVMDCHVMTGHVDYLLRVLARDLKDYERFVREELHAIPGIASIDTTKLAPAAVDTNKISNGSVNTDKLAMSSVDTTKLNADAVTTVKILDLNVTTQKIADAAINTAKLAPGSVDTGKLALSGPFGDLKGGLMVFSVESADEVDAILKADIYTAHGIFESWTIKPWNIVVSNLDTLKAGIAA